MIAWRRGSAVSVEACFSNLWLTEGIASRATNTNWNGLLEWKKETAGRRHEHWRTLIGMQLMARRSCSRLVYKCGKACTLHNTDQLEMKSVKETGDSTSIIHHDTIAERKPESGHPILLRCFLDAAGFNVILHLLFLDPSTFGIDDKMPYTIWNRATFTLLSISYHSNRYESSNTTLLHIRI